MSLSRTETGTNKPTMQTNKHVRAWDWQKQAQITRMWGETGMIESDYYKIALILQQ